MAVDPLKVVVQIQNKAELEELKAKAAQAEIEIVKLNKAFQAGPKNAGTINAFNAAVAPFAQTIATATPRIQTLQRSLTETGQSGFFAGQGLLQLSYAVDDAQYGLGAIVNNMAPVISGLGLGAGIAGAAQIAAVGISLLYRNWDKLSAMLQSAWEGGSSERLRILAERAETAAKSFEKLANTPTEHEQKGAQQRTKEFAEQGPENVRQQLQKALLASPHGPEMPEVRERPKGPLADVPGSPEWVARKILESAGALRTKEQAAEERNKAAAKQAAELVGQMDQPGEAGKAARDLVQRLIKELPNAFTSEFKTAFEESTPEAVKKREEKDADLKSNRSARTAIDRVHAEDAEKAKKQVMDRVRAEHDARLRGLEDEHDAIAKRRRELAEELRDQPKNIVGDTSDQYQQRVQQAALDNVQKESLATLKAMDKKLADLNEAMKDERKTVFSS